MFIDNTMKIRDRMTGKIYDCFPQSVDLNYDGRYVMRYNIGVNSLSCWTNVCCVYDNDEFNANYEVVNNDC